MFFKRRAAYWEKWYRRVCYFLYKEGTKNYIYSYLICIFKIPEGYIFKNLLKSSYPREEGVNFRAERQEWKWIFSFWSLILF